MNRIKKIVGMDWAGPIVRSGLQAAAVIIVGAGLDWVNLEIWKLAGLSAGAAVFAKIQELSRS